MKIMVVVIAVVLIAVGFLGRPYFEMLSDGQSMDCVVQQIKHDMSGDDSVKGKLTEGFNQLSCKAETLTK